MNGTRESFLSLDLFSLTCTFKNIFMVVLRGGQLPHRPPPMDPPLTRGQVVAMVRGQMYVGPNVRLCVSELAEP